MARNLDNLVGEVGNSMYHQVNNMGYATAVQTLMDMQILSKEDYERWRNGQVPYLEKVCKVNLKKLAAILNEMKHYAAKNNLKPSFTFYKQWGRKNKSTIKLRFCKTGNEYMENLYATHYMKSVSEERLTSMPEVISDMANQYKIIDESKWERAMHCMVFRNSVEPAFCVTFEVDVTGFKNMVKEKGLSFTLAFVHAVCKCANEVEALRYRFLDDKIVLYDRIDTAFTYLNKDTGLFKVVNVPFVEDLEEYVRIAGKTAEEQKEYFTGPLGNDVFQCSPMPWVTYTHISHTNSGKKDNATPLFDWGKYYEKDGRVMMPVSIQAHHSFVDGLHIGQFADALQNYLNSF